MFQVLDVFSSTGDKMGMRRPSKEAKMSEELDDCWKKRNGVRYLNICENNTGNLCINTTTRSVSIANVAVGKE